MKSSKRMLCQAVAVALSVMAASAVMAQSVPALVGGGSSLVAPSIGAEIAAFGTSQANISYSSVGSGKGQAGFLNNDPTQFGLPASAAPVDFANSDSALSTTQLNSYASGALSAVDGPLIEVPYIVTPITIPLVNAPVGTGPQTTTGQAHSVALNDADLCGIFSGKLTNWNQVINPDNNSAYAAGPITVVVRQDSSGTTDLLTRHLAAVCTTGASGNSAIAFTETQTFAATEFAAGLPANFVQASGSSGVANQLKTFATAGTAAVGYLSPDYTNSFLAPSSTAPAASNALPVASLVNANNPGTDVVPTYANASLALSNYAPPIAANASYQAQWIPNAAAPASGYPISGTSNIILSQCYANSAAQSALVNFLNNHYTGASFASIIHGNGFDTVPASYQTAIVANFLSNTSGNYLDIGDSGICTAPVTGR